ncbi:DUF1905 domain-containing protein [Microbacterium marinilacus]|nr:DUF1905 domain-containing protein [Microbacterium marinilacus]
MRIEFEAEVVRWQARTEAWYFVHVPEEISRDLRELPAPRRGFGSLRVEARIGGTTFRTSIFPGAVSAAGHSNGPGAVSAAGHSGRPGAVAYSLPVKRSVREAEGLAEGDVVPVLIDVLEL